MFIHLECLALGDYRGFVDIVEFNGNRCRSRQGRGAVVGYLNGEIEHRISFKIHQTGIGNRE
ncbi:hypothetical protein SDC9_27712 [bioreactor metagenome]|uniref:Uncharacterized protein n=1 Tax=bioreactor metagenome TaxID=1076179 RepID=A0A644USK7_9ZZZZ